jgi:putative ABC transport system permease protein
MIKDYFVLAGRNLWQRKLRSFLTVLGIVIGVFSIVALITVSESLSNSIEEQVNLFGADRFVVFASGVGDPTSRTGLSQSDLLTIRKQQGVDYAAPYLIESSSLEYKNEEKRGRVIGWPAEYSKRLFKDYDLGFLDGRAFHDKEKFSAIIGYKAADDMFKKKINLPAKIKINGKDFQVIGILKEVGNSEDDNAIYIPFDTMETLFDKVGKITMIDAKIKSGVNLDSVVIKTEKSLERKGGKDKYEVSTAAQLLDQINTILGIVQVVLIGIASISILVGAIGIMNSMYTAVIERIKEIGIMKSLGARNSNIVLIFIIESALLGAIGGLIGVIIGIILSWLIGLGAANSGFALLKITYNPYLYIMSILFSILVGMISGALPSKHAAKMSPIKALRS